MLSAMQRRVARLFLGLPEAAGFALTGGAALIFWQVVDRETVDLDFLTTVGEEITAVTEAFKAVLQTEGLAYEVVRSSPAFVRLTVRKPKSSETVLVDIGQDYRLREPVPTDLGPVLSVEELAADKLLALFGRAEARDFVDFFYLNNRLGIDFIMSLAEQKDPGLDRHVLATMIGRIESIPCGEFIVDDNVFEQMRQFYTRLQARLINECLTDS